MKEMIEETEVARLHVEQDVFIALSYGKVLDKMTYRVSTGTCAVPLLNMDKEVKVQDFAVLEDAMEQFRICTTRMIDCFEPMIKFKTL